MAASVKDVPANARFPENTPEPPGDIPLEPASVLVVDDDSRNLLAIESVFEGQDYAVVKARTGDEALRAVMNEEFAVLVLDVQMPDISGIELARLIKQRKSTQHIPIIFLTAHYREEEHAVLGYDVGAVDYLTKPLHPAVLRSKVNVFVDLFRKTRALARLNETMKTEIAERRTAEERFRIVVEAAPNAIVVFDESGAIRLVNPQAQHIFDCTETEFRQRRITDLTVDGRLLSTGTSIKTLRRCDGTNFPAEADCRPIQSSEGTLFLASILDLTERLQAEEALRAKAEAEAANEAKDRFLAVLSHELRTPLSPIVYAAALLEGDEQCPPHMRDLIATIQRNVRLEARLIDDLLDLARIRSGKLTLGTQMVEAHEILREALKISLGENTGSINLIERFEATRTQLQGDPVRLRQIFWNLLSNAAKFTPKNGTISVRTANSEDGSHLLVEVSDTGIGIEVEKLEGIFDAFVQGARNGPAGLGLGLSICKALVELHGGTIEARSGGLNSGASFLVKFPCSVLARRSRKEPSSRVPEVEPCRILIVEDHRDTAESLQMLLSIDGHTVHIAGSIREALGLADEQEFDILVSDIGLPDGRGTDLLTRLRERGLHSLGAVAVSGFGMEDDVERSRDAGFAEHLTKPVEFDSLRQAISRLSKKTAVE